jgi:hypothetical protein
VSEKAKIEPAGLRRLWHWQSDALTTRLDFIRQLKNYYEFFFTEWILVTVVPPELSVLAAKRLVLKAELARANNRHMAPPLCASSAQLWLNAAMHYLRRHFSEM